MIATLALAHVLSAGPNERAFRLTLSAKPGTRISVRAVATGWLASLCTAGTCALGQTVITIPARGKATFDLHLYEHASGIEPAHSVEVLAGPATLDLNV